MTLQAEIESFLNQLKAKLDVFGVVFRRRDKNLEDLVELDIILMKYPLKSTTS